MIDFGVCTCLVFAIAAITEAAEPKVPPDHAAKMKAGTELFQREVRELLSKHCLECHGGKQTKADFDLSTREKLLKSGYVEKTADASYLLSLIRHEEEPHMPFKLPKLSEPAIASIAKWIDLGAPYDRPLVQGKTEPAKAAVKLDRSFWSFQPLASVKPPKVRDEAWCRTDIDRFILAKLEERKIRPNGPTDRRRLIRRAFLDLTGLPPSPEQVEAFVQSGSTQGFRDYEKLIDQLLDSPHYGERWARHWLDVARFAESHGYEQDYDRPHAYHYRDFLIRAFNADMPFDQFIRWQLAGDELAPNDPLALMATGFLGAGAFPTQLTEAEFESSRYDELDDMVGTTGVAFLGLSIGCARCHDHKFDPIPAADYYRMASAFTTTIRAEVDLDLTPEKNAKIKSEWEAELRTREADLAAFEKTELPGRFRNWLGSHPQGNLPLEPWELLNVSEVLSKASKYVAQKDGSYLAIGTPPANDEVTIRAVAGGKVAAIRLEALADARLPSKGPGRAPNGNFALGDVRLEVSDPTSDSGSKQVSLAAARATHEQDKSSLSVAASLDSDPVSGWAVDGGGIGKDQAAVIDLANPIGGSGETNLTITLRFRHPNPQHSIGRFRLSASDRTGLPATVGKQTIDEKTKAALLAVHVDPKQTGENWTLASQWFARTDVDWLRLRKAVDDHKQAGPKLELVKAQITSEGLPKVKHHADERGFPHFYPETYILARGDVNQKQQIAQPSYLQVLMTPGKDESFWRRQRPVSWERTSFRRASLAEWITDHRFGAGHLAARVIVNRLWQHHFGTGLVATPNDFGMQGDRPTHPELLDWLATDLIEHGWKLKRLHKLIMTSSVYMQSADFDEARATVDRENAYYWRWTPRRLEAEAIRDSMLAVSGLLDSTMFGPGTLDENMRRRSVYFFIKRSKLIPTMMLFDWPEHLVSIGQRSTTTTAPQALLFMNSPQGRSYAEGFANRIGKEAGSAPVARAFQLAIGRAPSDREASAADAFLARQAGVYRQAQQSNPEQLALVDLCQAILGMNELIYTD